MVWLQWLGLWLASGVGGITGAILAIKAADVHNPLWQDDWLISLGAGLILVLAGPMLPLYMLWLCVQSVYEGRVPISNRAWWPARAQKFPPPDKAPDAEETALVRDDPETVLCRMIDVRRSKDARLSHRDGPEEWPMCELWHMTEAIIFDIVEQFFWLRDGGLSEEEALKRIEAFQFSPALSTLRATSTLSAYIADRIAKKDPDYIAVGPEILNATTEIAETWVRAQIEKIKAEPPYPATEWLKAQVSASQIDQERDLPFKGCGIVVITDGQAEILGTKVPLDKDWRRIKLRMVDGDELWTFSGHSRMGIALMREGRAIAHLTTLRVCL